jgi:hypothetical protein
MRYSALAIPCSSRKTHFFFFLIAHAYSSITLAKEFHCIDDAIAFAFWQLQSGWHANKSPFEVEQFLTRNLKKLFYESANRFVAVYRN